MLKQSCFLCKIVGALAIIGAINWGLVGVFQYNLVDQLFGPMSTLSRVVYGLVGLSGLAALISCIKGCPACKKA